MGEKGPEPIEVVAYSGHKGNERPIRMVRKGSKAVSVQHLIDRWYGPENDYFKFLGDDGRRYLIRLDRSADAWYLVKVLDRIGMH
jgi:hypothetical protein